MFSADYLIAAYAEFVTYRVQLCLQNVILLAELHDPLLKHHVVETPLLSGPFGCLVVASTSVPIAVILLVVGNKFALLAL